MFDWVLMYLLVILSICHVELHADVFLYFFLFHVGFHPLICGLPLPFGCCFLKFLLLAISNI